MSILKTFVTERRNTLLPREWLDVLGAERHVQQGEMLVVAPFKKDVGAMLVERGMDRLGTTLGRGSRQQKGLSKNWSSAVEAGLIDLSRPGVYASVRGGIVNALIVEILVDGKAVPIGKFVFDGDGYDRELIVVAP